MSSADPHRLRQLLLPTLLPLCLALAFPASLSAQHGDILGGLGAVNEGMGGVATGLALEPLGTLYWNPAGLSALPDGQQSRLSIGLLLVDSSPRLDSSVAAGSFGPGAPPVNLAGSTDSDSALALIPSFAWTTPLGDDGHSYFGLSGYGTGGFGVDFPLDATNPILSAQPPTGLGVGALFSDYRVIQVVGTFAREISPGWHVGVAPVLSLGLLEIAPNPSAAPDDANGDGFGSYPSTRDQATALGVGLQLGSYWQSRNGWSFGTALKTPTWFQSYDFQLKDELGAARQTSISLDLPAQLSIGSGYTAASGWRLGLDLRWLDFANTDGFEQGGLAADGAVRGFHWRSIPVVALGGLLPLNQEWSLLGGYSWNRNPIRDQGAFLAIASPAVISDHLSLGLRWQPAAGQEWALSYVHGLRNGVEGPYLNSGGAVAGTTVGPSLAVDSLSLSCSLSF